MGAECRERISLLRERMQREGIDAVLIPTADYHNSEYVADYFKTREFFTGFTGSAGTCIVTKEEACLWTDGRYFVQAERELEGSGVRLMRMMEPGVPTTQEYLEEVLPEGAVLAFDGRCVTDAAGSDLEEKLSGREILFRADLDPAEGIWTDRPAMPVSKAEILDVCYAGVSAVQKLGALREEMKKSGCAAYVSSRLDDNMWLLNIRGADVECNPVALSHLYLDQERFVLFIQEDAVTEALSEYIASCGGEILPYGDFAAFLGTVTPAGKVMYDPDGLGYSAALALCERLRTVRRHSPVQGMKAVKNETELQNLRGCYLRDSAALCSFIYWLKNTADLSAETEYTAAMKLDGLRAEIGDFRGLSFPTISAYGPNAAMMHYEAGPEDAAKLQPEAMLLVDSGGQYLSGTTDVTRTMALGPVSDEMRLHYTLTAVGNLQLMDAVFLHGCTGRAIDILSREPLWQVGIDYKCGTGHGIGYYLNVHENPPNIRWRYAPGMREDVIEPGMIVSDEPGVYLQDRYGIRIETILECVEKETNGDGTFLAFRPLTLVPLDRELLMPEKLTPRTREVLNAYHERVYREVAPLLPPEEAAWLREQTLPL